MCCNLVATRVRNNPKLCELTGTDDMDWNVLPHGRKVLRISGALNYSRYSEMQMTLARCGQSRGGGGDDDIDLDLSHVTVLDTSGLGLLLLVHDKLAASGRPIGLLNCGAQVRSMLQFARFERYFEIN